MPLKNVDTETVAKALLDMYSRPGIPEDVLSDQRTQFVSSCMQKVSVTSAVHQSTDHDTMPSYLQRISRKV